MSHLHVGCTVTWETRANKHTGKIEAFVPAGKSLHMEFFLLSKPEDRIHADDVATVDRYLVRVAERPGRLESGNMRSGNLSSGRLKTNWFAPYVKMSRVSKGESQ